MSTRVLTADYIRFAVGDSLNRKGFSDYTSSKDKDSHYFTKRFGDTLLVIRISNHGTWLNTWIDRYNGNSSNLNIKKKQRKRLSSITDQNLPQKIFYSFVFRDSNDSEDRREKHISGENNPPTTVYEIYYDNVETEIPTIEDLNRIIEEIVSIRPNTTISKAQVITNLNESCNYNHIPYSLSDIAIHRLIMEELSHKKMQ